MAERLEILLHQIVTQPDLKLSAIAQILANRDRDRQIVKAKELEKASLQKQILSALDETLAESYEDELTVEEA